MSLFNKRLNPSYAEQSPSRQTIADINLKERDEILHTIDRLYLRLLGAPGKPWSDLDKAFTFLDVGGYNYQHGQYVRDHQKFPNRIIVGTESYPKDLPDIWRIVERNPYVLGDFVWTCMDYLGEAGVGAARLDNERGEYFDSYCGDLDLCGFRKPVSYYRGVVWDVSPLEVFVHRPIPEGRRESVAGWGWPDELASWTWPESEGKPIQVAVYSKCDSVRLELEWQGNRHQANRQPVDCAVRGSLCGRRAEGRWS